jgi:hypothetical protein
MTAMASIRRCVRGTNLSYGSIAEWLELVYRIGGNIRASRRHSNRCDQLYRSLTLNDIRFNHDLFALEACERLFNHARGAGDVPSGHGLQRALTRAEIGARCWLKPATGSMRCAATAQIAHAPKVRASILRASPPPRSSASSSNTRTLIPSIACGPNAPGAWRTAPAFPSGGRLRP